MARFFPLAMLAATPLALAQGRFSRLQGRREAGECCPCPASVSGPGIATVTVTQQTPTPEQGTVTVERTVTAPRATVYVTQDFIVSSPASSAVTREVIVQVQPEPQTVTVVKGTPPPSPGPSAEVPQPIVVTKTIQPADSQQQQGPKMVSLSLQSSQPIGGETAATQTVTNTNSEEEPKTIVKAPELVTVTAPPPQVETLVESVDHYQTVTETVSSGDGDNVEITIVNIDTGDSTCIKKHSGQPCSRDRSSVIVPSEAPCPSFMNTTSIATVYNTIVVTLDSTASYNTTSAMGSPPPTDTTKPVMMVRERRPRALSQ